MILRLMLYRVECLPPNTLCLRNENLLCKIKELEKSLLITKISWPPSLDYDLTFEECDERLPAGLHVDQ